VQAQDELRCVSKRADAAGKYQRCLQKWQSKCFAKDDCDQRKLSKCRIKYAAVWPKLQALAGTSCDVARLVDNGDGTVTDNLTGLVWEKKDDAGGIHDKDNLYTWSTGAPWAENGSAFTDFLSGLNGGGGFAGSNGWRLPTIAELQTILVEPYPCTIDPCIDVTFGPTQSDYYWSASTYGGDPSYASYVFFLGATVFDNGGLVIAYPKTNNGYVRAVRGGF
jgi:hypothetical protein